MRAQRSSSKAQSDTSVNSSKNVSFGGFCYLSLLHSHHSVGDCCSPAHHPPSFQWFHQPENRGASRTVASSPAWQPDAAWPQETLQNPLPGEFSTPDTQQRRIVNMPIYPRHILQNCLFLSSSQKNMGLYLRCTLEPIKWWCWLDTRLWKRLWSATQRSLEKGTSPLSFMTLMKAMVCSSFTLILHIITLAK